MPNLTASIPHQLTRADVKQRIQEQVGVLRQQYGTMVANLQESWNGDRMDFSFGAMGQSISGHMIVDDRMVHVEVVLPLLLSMLAGTLKNGIEQQGKLLLSGPSTKPGSGKVGK